MHFPSFRELHGFPQKIVHDDMGQLYLNVLLKQLAKGLVGVFIPLYLIDLNYSFNEVLLFFAVLFGTVGLLSPLAMRWGSRLGMKHIILYRTPLAILYFLGLQLGIPKYPSLLCWVAGIGGLQLAMYWMPMHSLFTRSSHPGKRGREVGLFESLMHFAGLVGPVIGGVIIVLSGYSLLFTITIIIIAISAIPLLFTPDIKPSLDISYKRMFSKEHTRFTAGFFAEGITMAVSMVVWPLFIYAMVESVLSVGFVATLTELGIVIFTLYIGKLSDVMKKERILNLGGVLFSITWVARYWATTAVKIFSIGFLDGFIRVMINVPFRAVFYDKAIEENPEEFVLFREISLTISRVAVLLFLMLFTDKFIAAFVIAGLASLVFAKF